MTECPDVIADYASNKSLIPLVISARQAAASIQSTVEKHRYAIIMPWSTNTIGPQLPLHVERFSG